MREALLVLLAACGRVGFDVRGASGDAAIDLAAIDSGDAAAATWSHLTAYADQTCALFAGYAYCWGNIGDESGGQAQTIAATPHRYAYGPGVVDVAAGETFTCVAGGGSVHCFGITPSPVIGYGGASDYVTAVTAGRSFVCILANGIECWGANDAGQLGLGDTTARADPTANGLAPPGYTQIRAGDDHACASGPAGSVCWGHNDNGTMGTGSNNPASQLTPQAVMNVATLPLIAGWHACSLESAGVFCWGRGIEGELGDGGNVSSPTPSEVIPGGSVLATGGGPTDYDASCAVFAGQTKCWGAGAYGRLGQGTAASSLVPVDVVGLPATPTELAIGYDHACALLTTDEIYCWGRGDLGQLGDGLMMSSMSPVKVALP